jgi:cytochrome c-type protein NapC
MNTGQSERKRGIAGILVIGIVLGIILWGGFNTAMEWTNREAFCISCHEMEANVYKEYTDTIHYSNRTGVRATCPDCHVPKEWTHKLIRKVQATNELYHHFKGSVDTPAKFDAKRFELAQHVWTAMKKTDSRECRNCHDYDSMNFAKQEGRSQKRHEEASDQGLTCIDCHKGIAHRLPKQYNAQKDIPGNSPYYEK